MLRSLTPYIVLFVGCMALAYYASIPAEDKGGSSVKWVSVGTKGINSLILDTKKETIEVKPQPGGAYWVTVTAKEEAKKEEHSKKAPFGPEPENPQPEKPHDDGNGHNHGHDHDHDKSKGDLQEKIKAPTGDVIAFKANKRFDEFLDGLGPLYAKRVVGKVNEASYEEFGLSNSLGDLTIQLADRSLDFSFGKRSYGSSNMYLLDNGRSEVILVNSKPFDDLKRAKSLMFERQIFDLLDGDIKGAKIIYGQSEAEWDHTERNSKGKLVWRAAEEGSKPNTAYSSWMDKVSKLRVQRYAKDSEQSRLSGAQDIFRVTLLADEPEELIFKRAPEEGGNSQGKNSYWVTSKFLGHYAQVSTNRVESLEKDLSNLLNKDQ